MKLIVNADDFGVSPAVNYGILHCFKEGIVTSTTLLVNQEGFEHAVSLHKQYNIPTGIHLTLTFGKPILKNSITLADENGNFHKQTFFWNNVQNYNKEEIKKEFIAQIEKALKNGVKISHLDSHHHVHTSDYIKEIFFEVAKMYNFPFRPKREWNNSFSILGKEERLHFNDSFFDKGASLENIKDILNKYEGKTLELMCHPSFGDNILKNNSSYFDKRFDELSILTSTELKKFISDNNIYLINYNHLNS